MASVGDIAIVGVSFKMPQDAEDELGFWKVLESRKNVMTEWPPSRTNIDAIYDARPGSQSKVLSPKFDTQNHAWQADLGPSSSKAKEDISSDKTPPSSMLRSSLSPPERRPLWTRSID